MTRMERVEVTLIPLVVGMSWFSTPHLRWTPAIGTLVGYAAALLLGQGLVRDVARLLVRRTASGPRQRIVCLCAESTIGMGLIVVAVSLTLLGMTQTVAVGRVPLASGLGAVLVLGFLAKDFVFVARKFSLSVRREKDHLSIIPW